jgi:hypothetical protein
MDCTEIAHKADCQHELLVLQLLQFALQSFLFTYNSFNNAVSHGLRMEWYPDVVGELVPLRCEGRPKAVRDKVAGKGQQQYY